MAVFSGLSRVTRLEKNWLNFDKHASWLDNILSNPYKLPFICCQFLTSAILFRFVYLVFQSSQYYDLDHSPLSEFWNGLLIVISFQFALVTQMNHSSWILQQGKKLLILKSLTRKWKSARNDWFLWHIEVKRTSEFWTQLQLKVLRNFYVNLFFAVLVIDLPPSCCHFARSLVV